MARPSVSKIAAADELRTAIIGLARQLHRQDHLSDSKTAVLSLLIQHGELSIAELARHSDVRHQSMARTVKLLEEMALVKTRPHEIDRRSLAVEITAEGIEIERSQRFERATAIAQTIQEKLDLNEQDALIELPGILRKLTS